MNNTESKKYHILMIGSDAEAIHAITYNLYHVLVDDFSNLKTRDEKKEYIKNDQTLTFHQANNFNAVIAKTLSSCNGSTPDLVVIIRNKHITEQLSKETRAFLLNLQETYGYYFPKKIIACAYDRSNPYKIDDDLTLQTYKIGLNQDEKKQFYADIKKIIGTDEKERNDTNELE